MAWEPETGALWTVGQRARRARQRSRARLPHVGTDGAFYGWPYSYYGAHVDTRSSRSVPISSQSAMHRITRSVRTSRRWGSRGRMATHCSLFGTGMFIGQQGSWNRKLPAGYDVVFIPFVDGKPTGAPVEVLSDS